MKAYDLIDHDVTGKALRINLTEDGKETALIVPVDLVAIDFSEDGGPFVKVSHVLADETAATLAAFLGVDPDDEELDGAVVYEYLLPFDIEVEVVDRPGASLCEECNCPEGTECTTEVGTYTYVDADNDHLVADGFSDAPYHHVVLHIDSTDGEDMVAIPRKDLPVVMGNLLEQAGIIVSDLELNDDDELAASVAVTGGTYHPAALVAEDADLECIMADIAFLCRAYEVLATALEAGEEKPETVRSAEKMQSLRTAYLGAEADPLEEEPEFVREAWARLFEAAAKEFGQ